MENVEQDLIEIVLFKFKCGWLIVIIVVLLLLGGGVGVYFVLGGCYVMGDKVVEVVLEKKFEFYLLFDLVFVVNFCDDQVVCYLQVGVSLMSYEQFVFDVVKEVQLVICNELLMFFSGQNYENLIDVVGKQKLQVQVLVVVQKIISVCIGKFGIDVLYFISFVMQ